MKKGYLVFENGRVFEGERFGACADAMGEAVFTTCMCGYLETLTDPAYCGQLVIQTFPLIGNYGVISEDLQGSCFVGGYIVHQLCETPSNFRSEGTLDEYLKQCGVPGLCGVDTREIARMLRSSGPMKAALVDEVPENLEFLRDLKEENYMEKTGGLGYTSQFPGTPRFHVTLINYGANASVVQHLHAHGCAVEVVPFNTPASEILVSHPDGVLLSGGPGDPARAQECIEQIRQLIGKVPVFAMGLGHQMLTLALGGETKKMALGHRGANHPVHDALTGRTYITSQNHGYVVSKLPENVTARFVHVNDGTCEGFESAEMKLLSVQFDPECCSGTSPCLFQRFVDMMGE